MSIVKMHNKKSGTTYVYESVSYWDKEKKQPRNERKLIGKLDPVTGEIVPTSRAKHEEKTPVVRTGVQENAEQDSLVVLLKNKDAEISALKSKILKLELQCKCDEAKLNRIRAILGDTEV